MAETKPADVPAHKFPSTLAHFPSRPMQPPSNNRNPFGVPPSSRCGSGHTPLTAERAMIDQIRSKLERAHRRLARTSPGSSGSAASSSSTYISSSERYNKPPVQSVLFENMPATASKPYASPPSSSRHGEPLLSNRRPPSSSTYESTQSFKSVQYKSKSKLPDADPLNGGPPPMSTPYLVYSNPTTDSSQTTKSTRSPRSAMRSGLARPPSSHVRFESRTDLTERDRKETNRTQREREARHREKGKARPIAAVTRDHRSTSVENPPSSAIKRSAYDELVQALPTSPGGRLRRSSIGTSPPKSDIKISAFDDVIPRRRSSQEKQPKKLAEAKQPQDKAEQVVIEPTPASVVKSVPSPGVPEPETSNSVSNEDDGDTSANETDDSYDFEFSDFDTDFEDLPVAKANVVDPGFDEESRAGDEKGLSSLAAELSTAKKEELQPVSRLTARDLALLALGRAGTSSRSDLGSPVPSANGRNYSTKMLAAKVDTLAAKSNTPAPMSYTPASSAFPSARALGRRAPATTGRTNRMPPPVASTSVSSYVRRSLARAPMDLKNHLPPSIGVLSDLSSGSSTFAMNPSCFYEVTWRSGEFAFSVQRVYTEENEYEFDDRNQEPQLFLRMLLNTERSTCKSFGNVRVGDVLIRVGDAYVSDLGLEGSGTVLTKFFAKLTGQTPIRLTFQRMSPSDWEGGVEL